MSVGRQASDRGLFLKPASIHVDVIANFDDHRTHPCHEVGSLSSLSPRKTIRNSRGSSFSSFSFSSVVWLSSEWELDRLDTEDLVSKERMLADEFLASSSAILWELGNETLQLSIRRAVHDTHDRCATGTLSVLLLLSWGTGAVKRVNLNWFLFSDFDKPTGCGRRQRLQGIRGSHYENIFVLG